MQKRLITNLLIMSMTQVLTFFEQRNLSLLHPCSFTRNPELSIWFPVGLFLSIVRIVLGYFPYGISVADQNCSAEKRRK